MKNYTVEVEYLLPVYQTVVVKANSLDEACQKAVEKADDDWDGARESHDSCTATYVSGVVTGAHDDVYSGGRALRVPKKHGIASIKKDLFPK